MLYWKNWNLFVFRAFFFILNLLVNFHDISNLPISWFWCFPLIPSAMSVTYGPPIWSVPNDNLSFHTSSLKCDIKIQGILLSPFKIRFIKVEILSYRWWSKCMVYRKNLNLFYWIAFWIFWRAFCNILCLKQDDISDLPVSSVCRLSWIPSPMSVTFRPSVRSVPDDNLTFLTSSLKSDIEIQGILISPYKFGFFKMKILS